MSRSRISKKVGCFGLSADPPHFGHLEVAKLVLKKKLVDEVWLIPCFEHSFGKPLSSSEHRWQMAKFLEEPGIKVSDAEFKRQGKSYAIDTVSILKKEYPECRFLWVIGSDILKSESFLSWKDWEHLAFITQFVVVQRSGYEIEIERYSGLFILAEGKVAGISSSDIRERVRHNFSIEYLVSQKVKEYIEKHGLYKEAGNEAKTTIRNI